MASTSMLPTSEIESLRFHLGYGNVGVQAYPYTPDGFFEVFTQVVAPNLSVSTEATASSPATIEASATATMVLDDVTSILPFTRLVVDVGDDTEVLEVKAVSGMTVTAKFALAHTAPFPVQVLSGVARLRLLLHAADKAWRTEHSSDITGSAGIKQLGKGEIEYFQGGAILADVSGQYARIQQRISSLVRVPIGGASDAGGAMRLEPY